MGNKDPKKKKQAKAKKRKAKLDKKKKGNDNRQREFSCQLNPENDHFLSVHVRLPDGGKMPTNHFEGQDGLDRIRRMIIGRSFGLIGRKPTPHERAWMEHPAHGNPEGVVFDQQSASHGAILEIQVPVYEEAWIGEASSDRKAASRFRTFLAAQWEILDKLDFQEIADRLAKAKSGDMGPVSVRANGWRFAFSYEDNLNMFSAQLIPVGRSSNRDDWHALGAVMSRSGVPPTEELCVLFTDLSDDNLDCNSVLKWMWRSQ